MRAVTLLLLLMGLFGCDNSVKDKEINAMKQLKDTLDSYAQEIPKEDYEQAQEEFAKYYNNYSPLKIEALREAFTTEIEIQIIGAFWCPDTHREVARFTKIVDSCEVKVNWHFYAVDDQKKPIRSDFSAEHKVKKVPTFFVYKQGELLGQIIEKPQTNLESDLLNILQP